MMNPDRDDLLKRLDTMKGQVQYCAEMAKSTMSYLRHDASELRTVSLNEIVGTCLKVAAPLLREQRVELLDDLDTALSQTVCDIVLMRQALMNIVTNACQAMEGQDGKRQLHIKSWNEDGKVCLSIEDTGSGIPQELRESVFETFFSTKGQSGTGLGLGVVRNVMRRFNGTVTLEDGSHGNGACFVIKMPATR